jgi:hypothetical protein
VVVFHRRQTVLSVLLGVALAADAMLLTGLLDITGGPFNPFIVMYAAYIWVALGGARRIGLEPALAGPR